ncbi:uridine diphosphate glucose pyrophosphatase NUDT14-like [Saccoglossus kowalevskii]|uniref:Uridine diphosphate glucose pyrophosphatase-like n=1 Tax=Saccoglossus kowalevskii TaxID=10224 RepID=A0ABM0GQR2_SACKO|nr:PREDICTED: uridine diphosphate glucose pyrophosphatase-like [Saccoglossus kowalevskii]
MADNIADVRVLPCTDSKYIRPFRIHYKQDGIDKTWDYMKVYNSVIILIFNVTRKVFIMVKQFRPAVYAARVEVENGRIDTTKFPGSLGMTFELCAGLVDKSGSIEQLAKQEILEECGYDVKVECLERITSTRNVGTSGSLQTLYYVEVTDEMKVAAGGGLTEEGEMIEVIELPLKDTKHFIMDESIPKPPNLQFAFMWFYANKAKNHEN